MVFLVTRLETIIAVLMRPLDHGRRRPGVLPDGGWPQGLGVYEPTGLSKRL